jgi:hypothetical protein
VPAAEMDHSKFGDDSRPKSLIGVANALRLLRATEQVSYLVDSSLNLVCHNKAWDRFAQENSAPELAGGAAIGTNLLRVTDESLRPFYSDAFNRVVREKMVWEWQYECSSPERFRKFLMRVHPVTLSGWIFVTNSLLVEDRHALGATDSKGYINSHGQIQLCIHCRCSKRATPPERWDFVPANLKAQLANVRNDLCPTCRGYYYATR